MNGNEDDASSFPQLDPIRRLSESDIIRRKPYYEERDDDTAHPIDVEEAMWRHQCHLDMSAIIEHVTGVYPPSQIEPDSPADMHCFSVDIGDGLSINGDYTDVDMYVTSFGGTIVQQSNEYGDMIIVEGYDEDTVMIRDYFEFEQPPLHLPRALAELALYAYEDKRDVPGQSVYEERTASSNE